MMLHRAGERRPSYLALARRDGEPACHVECALCAETFEVAPWRPTPRPVGNAGLGICGRCRGGEIR